VNNRAQPKFYKNHLLVLLREMPPVVSQALGEKSNPTCWQGNLKLAAGGEIPFYWWQWSVRTTITAGGPPRASYKYFLAVSFPPNLVSEEFEKQVMQTRQKDDFSQNFV